MKIRPRYYSGDSCFHRISDAVDAAAACPVLVYKSAFHFLLYQIHIAAEMSSLFACYFGYPPIPAVLNKKKTTKLA